MVIWISPSTCFPPHKVTHPERVKSLMNDFYEFGWWGEPLVGYFTWDMPTGTYGCQLLSGAHRWSAAYETGVRIPVFVRDEVEVEEAWGDVEKWQKIMDVMSVEIGVRLS